MIILHISNISANEASGMSVVIPQHVKYQNKIADVALLNLNDNKILNEEEIKIFKVKNISNDIFKNLDAPFCNPDLIILHGIYYLKFRKIEKLIRKMRIPYILVPHGCLSINSLRSKYLKKKLFIKLILNKVIKNANYIQYLSQLEAETSIKGKKEIILPNGVEILKINNEKNIFSKYFRIIYIGRLSIQHKGLDVLLEACNVIKNDMKNNNIILEIYGPDCDGDKQYLDKYINDNGLKEIVKIYGSIFGKDKNDKINASDIFIQTSRWEGQPIGIMEAMQIGKPVIVTYGTNISKEVEEYNCGWISECNAKKISENILEAFYNRKYIDIKGKNSKKMIREKYSWEIVSRITCEKYEEIILNERYNKC
ncbi:glycosyltransferase [Clostridium thermobutyricum]|uniref:glycosyltransferase n=1 Tax=Clostridium thermobutyricum TaxID=29372 RepID=UPI0018A8DC28|nr:glycosyltransferase [Clostridium thermobutyricum]